MYTRGSLTYQSINVCKCVNHSTLCSCKSNIFLENLKNTHFKGNFRKVNFTNKVGTLITKKKERKRTQQFYFEGRTSVIS